MYSCCDCILISDKVSITTLRRLYEWCSSFVYAVFGIIIFLFYVQFFIFKSKTNFFWQLSIEKILFKAISLLTFIRNRYVVRLSVLFFFFLVMPLFMVYSANGSVINWIEIKVFMLFFSTFISFELCLLSLLS